MKIPKEWPTDEMLFAAREACDDMFQTDFIRAFKAALTAAPTPPAQGAEPVAVIDESDDGKFADLTVEGTFLKRGTKLYTRPDNSELRQAAKGALELLEFLKEEGYFQTIGESAVITSLRSALEGE